MTFAACDSLSPPAESGGRADPSRPQAEAQPQGTPQRVAQPAPSPPAPDLPNTVIQVEVSGSVSIPLDAPKARLLVVITDGQCFQGGSHYLGTAQPGPSGNFLMTVFPPVGSKIQACAALVEPMRSGISWWGRADRGPMDVQGRGKMVYQGTTIPIRRAPEVQLPAGLKVAP